MYKIVMLADIKQAFLQIEMDPKDRDALRFLWVENPKELSSPILEYRFTKTILGKLKYFICCISDYHFRYIFSSSSDSITSHPYEAVLSDITWNNTKQLIQNLWRT